MVERRDRAAERNRFAWRRGWQGRRRALELARHYREAEGLSLVQIADRLGRSPATVEAYCYDPTGGEGGGQGPLRQRVPRVRRVRAAAQRQGRRLRVLQGGPPRGRSSGAGRTSGCSSRCARGASSTAGSRRRMTGRAHMRGGAVEMLWRDWRSRHGRRRASSRTSSERGRPPTRRRRGRTWRRRQLRPDATTFANRAGCPRYLRSGRSCHQDSDSTSTPPTATATRLASAETYSAQVLSARVWMRARRQDAPQLRGEACGERLGPMAARSCPAPAVFAHPGDPTRCGDRSSVILGGCWVWIT